MPDTYLDEQGNEIASPKVGVGSYLDEQGNEIPAPPIDVPGLKTTHAMNRAMENMAYSSAKHGTERDAALLRGVGGFASMLPAAGPFLAGGADVAAQMVEKAGGQRQTYNPLRTAAEVSIGLVPSMPIGKMVKPTTGLIRNASKGATITGAHILEGAGRGAAATAATDISEGQLPSAEELKAGATGGGMFSPIASVFSLNQLRRTTQRATSSYNAASHVAKAIGLPTGAQHGAENLQQGVGLALTHAAAQGTPANTLKDLSSVAGDARKTFLQAHIEPMKERFGGQIINPAPILKEAEKGLKPINYEADPALTRNLQTAKNVLSKPRTATELLDYYHILQGETEPFRKSSPAERASKFGDAEWRFKIRLQQELQNKLADHFDQSRALQDGTTVDALRASGNGFKTIHRQYGSLAFLSNLSKEASNKLDNMRMVDSGELFGAGEAAEKVLAPIFLSKRRMAGQALDMIVGGRNDPDNLVRKAQKVFSKYGTPTKGPSAMSGQPETLQPPTPGQTVPITVSPVPEPPETLTGPIVQERRGGTFTQSEHRRSSDQPIMQQAAALQDALGNAKAAGNYATVKPLQDQLFALYQKYPWISDFIKNRTSQYGGPRGSQ